MDTEYASIDDMKRHIRQHADADEFPWQRFGGVPVGETVTLKY